MTESWITCEGVTTVPAAILQAFGCKPGTRLVWHVLPRGRLVIRVKNKSAADVKGIVKPPEGLVLKVGDMRA